MWMAIAWCFPYSFPSHGGLRRDRKVDGIKNSFSFINTHSETIPKIVSVNQIFWSRDHKSVVVDTNKMLSKRYNCASTFRFRILSKTRAHGQSTEVCRLVGEPSNRGLPEWNKRSRQSQSTQADRQDPRPVFFWLRRLSWTDSERRRCSGQVISFVDFLSWTRFQSRSFPKCRRPSTSAERGLD